MLARLAVRASICQSAKVMTSPMSSLFYEADDHYCREVEQWWQERIRYLIGNGQAYDAAALFEDFELERKLTIVRPESDEIR
ncbi:hypothetical protein [Synechococcus sp. MIT S9504]|uniref:hypothetical protein n=1 Tax=Synechococcus sp. MIT S9504 TaxID=1801628 RepID=UPI00082F6EF2|nr:hypothetical protein [Synechococcus sp. MIT S9504]